MQDFRNAEGHITGPPLIIGLHRSFCLFSTPTSSHTFLRASGPTRQMFCKYYWYSAPITVAHFLCSTVQPTRTMPEGIPMKEKMLGSLWCLQRTADFVKAFGVPVWAFVEEKKNPNKTTQTKCTHAHIKIACKQTYALKVVINFLFCSIMCSNILLNHCKYDWKHDRTLGFVLYTITALNVLLCKVTGAVCNRYSPSVLNKRIFVWIPLGIKKTPNPLLAIKRDLFCHLWDMFLVAMTTARLKRVWKRKTEKSATNEFM